MNKKELDNFQRGYFCAVAALIKMQGQVDAQTKELFRSGAGSYDIKKLRAYGVDENDIEIFEEHKKELI